LALGGLASGFLIGASGTASAVAEELKILTDDA
jgi:hypothetical protein